MVQFDFQKKHVVITGGTRGIGNATAGAFVRAGANVTICGVNPDRLEAACVELDRGRGRVRGMLCDVSRPEQLERLARDTADCFGPIHIWVNNAGFMPSATVAGTDMELLERLFRVNVQPVCQSAKLAQEYMTEGGVIINASSFAAKMPSVNYGVYAAAKAAVASLTRTMAAELAPRGIRVVGYLPGLIYTELSRDSIEKFGEKMYEPIASHRHGTAEEIADVLLFLASDAASYVNGVCLEISGGKYATQNPWVAWQEAR